MDGVSSYLCQGICTLNKKKKVRKEEKNRKKVKEKDKSKEEKENVWLSLR